VNSLIVNWALRWGIPHAGLVELEKLFGISAGTVPATVGEHSEAYIQSCVRLEAGRKGVRLWRNNVGALLDQRGIPVRYGLANDSKKLNEKIKSGDLIGWRPIRITSDHVGAKIAQFVSRECKTPDWVFTGTDREQAQLRWIEAVSSDGGDACFVTGEGTL
jgi:hypothetical protein